MVSISRCLKNTDVRYLLESIETSHNTKTHITRDQRCLFGVEKGVSLMYQYLPKIECSGKPDVKLGANIRVHHLWIVIEKIIFYNSFWMRNADHLVDGTTTKKTW